MVQCSSSNEHFFAMSQPRLSNQNLFLSKKITKTKKIILNFFIIELLLYLYTLFCIYTVNLGNYDYEYTITSIEPNECKIHNFTNPTEPTNLIIPSEINGYTVTAIGENSFQETQGILTT